MADKSYKEETEIERWTENGGNWWNRNVVFIKARIQVDVYTLNSNGEYELSRSYTYVKTVGEESNASN